MALSKAFLYGLNDVQIDGFDGFLDVLKQRASSPDGSRRGLLTVSNHVSVLDDPLIWGILPLKYALDPENLRWSLGAHDICFRSKLASSVFSLGQVLPTHRLLHSPHGGLFQPTMTEAIQLLSADEPQPPGQHRASTFSTMPGDEFPSPSYFNRGLGSWVHVFPEARVHQSPDLSLRYFKWGVSRMVLEANPAPLLVPIFIDGTQHIMNENRGTPRWLPRIRRKVHIIFGRAIDTEHAFSQERGQWRKVIGESGDPYMQEPPKDQYLASAGGDVSSLRIEVANTIRRLILDLRRNAGYPEEDPVFAKAGTWRNKPSTRR